MCMQLVQFAAVARHARLQLYQESKCPSIVHLNNVYHDGCVCVLELAA